MPLGGELKRINFYFIIQSDLSILGQNFTMKLNQWSKTDFLRMASLMSSVDEKIRTALH